jgi:UDP-N-acetyl-D-glucosamine dehydrogenase
MTPVLDPEARTRELFERIRSRDLDIAVIGLGSVGLPLANAFVDAGFRVLGLDVDAEKLARIERGENTRHHFAPGFTAHMAASGRFHATADAERVRGVDVAIVCVPTPLSPLREGREGRGGREEREPDLTDVIASCRTLAAQLPRGALVVLESTTYPGTTRNVVGEVFRERGFRVGEDLFLAYSPEREDPGRDIPTRSIPKLVGGTCERSGALAEALYSAAIERVLRVSSAEVAEAAKLLENVFRAVNIALVNELKVALDAMHIDVWETIEAAATKPYGFMKFTPGPGLGGHCLPIDPFYLSWIARQNGVETRLIELAGEISRAMPGYVVERTRAALASVGKPIEGARILILGLAYKPDVDVVTESPSIRLIELLEELGASAHYSDPHVPIAPKLDGHDVGDKRSLALDPATIASFDAVIVSTNHSAFDYDALAAHAQLVVDTRNALDSRLRGRASYFKA